MSFTPAGGDRYYLTPAGQEPVGYEEFLRRKRREGVRRSLPAAERKAAVRANVLARWFDETEPGQRWEAGLLGYPMSIQVQPDGRYRAEIQGHGLPEASDHAGLEQAAAWCLDVALRFDDAAGPLDRRTLDDGERQDAPVDSGGSDIVDPDELSPYVEGGDQEGPTAGVVRGSTTAD